MVPRERHLRRSNPTFRTSPGKSGGWSKLGKMRSPTDSIESQVQMLYALGIRKITPIHATNNPLGGDFMIWQNQFNLDWQDGNLVADEDDPNSITHVFQPVMPFALEETLGENWLAVLRPTLSFVYSADQPSGPGTTPGTVKLSNERGCSSSKPGFPDFRFCFAR